jgi:SM-20-related protein
MGAHEDGEAMLDYRLTSVFDRATCDTIIHELRAADGAAATVYGRSVAGAVDAGIRKATRLVAPATTHALVRQQLDLQKRPLEEHFNISLGDCEEPQFLRYVTGDYFVAHQDGNTGLIFDDSRFRKISVVIFLNEGYSGGALVLHGHYPDLNLRVPIDALPGTMVAFRPETTHEVTPVTNGERYSVVSWYR